MIIALTVTALLAIAAIMLLRAPEQKTHGGLLASFEPSRVRQIRIESPGRGAIDIARGGAGDWLLMPAGKPEEAWPAAAVQVRAALRLLSTLKTDSTRDSQTIDAAQRSILTLTLDDAKPLVLRFGTQALAGTIPAESLDSNGNAIVRGRVGAEIAGVLAGVEAWRDAAALPNLGTDVSRITLRGASGSVALARVQGKWALREPVSEAADNDAVSKLAARLASLRVDEFLDSSDPRFKESMSDPRAQAIVESDERDGSGAIVTTRKTLSIGRSRDLANSSLFARIEGVAPAPRFVAIASGTLASLITDPTTYIARRAATQPAAEIGGIVVARAGSITTYARTLDGWMISSGDESPRAIPGDDATLAALLDIAAGAEAERITITLPNAGAAHENAPISSITLKSIGGTPLVEFTLELRRASEGDPASSTPSAPSSAGPWIVLTKPNGVARSYSPSRFAALRSLLE